jgi:hypothetical protein
MPETNIPVSIILLNGRTGGKHIEVKEWDAYKVLFPFIIEKWGPIRDLSVDAYIDQPFN